MQKLSVLLIALCLLSCGALPETPYEVELEAGDVDLQNAPVSAAVDASTVSETTPVCVEINGQEQPGQVAITADGQAEVWWTATLHAGTSETYILHLGNDCSEEAFTWSKAEENASQLLFAGSPVLEYVHQTYNPDDVEQTKKPFHHVFAPDGSRLITKGPGGLYSHHRGLFFGYNHVDIDTERVDIWHSREGEHQSHEAVVETVEGPVFGGHTARVLWKDRSGEPFIEELRTVRVFRQTGNELLIDFSSRLESLRGSVDLGGDRQHAGVHFRAAQDVADAPDHTRFIRPFDWRDLPPEQEYNGEDYLDLPWNAMRFPLEGQSYTVAYLSAPANPEGAEFSERSYGRFGEFFPYELTEENPLEVSYRLWVVAGDDVTGEAIDQQYRSWTTPPDAAIAAN